MRCLALCLLVAAVAVGCGGRDKADLSARSGVTTTERVPETEPTTSLVPVTVTTAPLPTTAPATLPDTTPPATSPPATSPPTTRPPVLAGQVTYEIAGGIAGVSERLSITTGGNANFTSNAKNVNFTLTPDRATALAAALNQADFAMLKPVYGFATPDGFEYRVAYRGRTVLIFGSAEPSRLKPALAILTQEMQRARQL